MFRVSATAAGPLFASVAMVMFSLNDVAMKVLSSGYALHELVLIRSIVGLAVVVCIMVPLNGTLSILKTRRLGMHVLRASFVVFANLCFFLGLAVLPLADAVAIFFISPFLIIIASVLFLGEVVRRRRWSAIAFGMIGVLIVLRPGTEAFQVASLLPLAAAFGYSGLHIMTRFLRDTENAVSMTFYIQIVFIVVCVVFGLLFEDGKLAEQSNASLAFLFREWRVPDTADLPLMLILGIFASIGGYCISRAYRLGEAAIVAPVEYLVMPLSIAWGVLVFGTWPDAVAWCGIGLILSSGLYTVWREHQLQKTTAHIVAR
ncbi:putative drug/metabolite superfamily transporter [Octadecabacter antarcticus 307]|uniref:Putative drug/metabolite superfamily transporter n=1 Tax=Octadecabacter antarcticus 307 TaxID=391626 RepID=M9R5J9_9RHOB|nr:DMT family transporter [Octadecabacter antarcticus]AGI67053.1 putative drug/metabolite superfamily transporter [Octadecabacter antarcticus 307]